MHKVTGPNKLYSVAGPLSDLVLSIHISPLQSTFLPPLHSYIHELFAVAGLQ